MTEPRCNWWELQELIERKAEEYGVDVDDIRLSLYDWMNYGQNVRSFKQLVNNDNTDYEALFKGLVSAIQNKIEDFEQLQAYAAKKEKEKEDSYSRGICAGNEITYGIVVDGLKNLIRGYEECKDTVTAHQ